jgi:hypothetical protein
MILLLIEGKIELGLFNYASFGCFIIGSIDEKFIFGEIVFLAAPIEH